jgi:hypothetical protein
MESSFIRLLKASSPMSVVMFIEVIKDNCIKKFFPRLSGFRSRYSLSYIYLRATLSSCSLVNGKHVSLRKLKEGFCWFSSSFHRQTEFQIISFVVNCFPQQPHFPIIPLETWQFRICRILWKFALLRDEGMTRQTLERDTSGNSQVSTELCGFSWM